MGRGYRRVFLGLSLLVGACFGGDFAQGLACESDADCGPSLSCIEGLCGGPGDLELCGNGLVDAGESCDDGNTENGDGCSANCDLCGNGLTEAEEECDDGNMAEDDFCTPECRLPACGDGFLSASEECEDGTDGCTPACTFPACGDGFVNVDGEVCDDGNDVEIDDCTTSCTESPEATSLELTLTQVKQFEFSWEPALGAESYRLFERVNVGDEFVQVGGDIMGESVALTVPLHFRPNARYQLQACNPVRCTESGMVDVTGTLAKAVGYFKASNTGPGDWFGRDVAISDDGTTLVVGAPFEASASPGIDADQEDDTAESAGAVYVFVRVGAEWSQQAYVKASDPAAGNNFGRKVAVSADGNTLAVGASEEGAQDHGAVYMFVRDGVTWSQQMYLVSSNIDFDDKFGSDVALSDDGDTLAVGAVGEASIATGIDGDEADDSAPFAGAVYVFERDGGEWSQQAYVKASNTGEDDEFGESVALSADGNTLAVGARGEALDAGAVYVFARDGATWSHEAYVKASNAGEQDNFGWMVALSDDGETMAVGAHLEDSQDNAATDAGAVYVFRREGGSWSEQAYVKASNTGAGDQFGYSVALSSDGEILAVGAIHERSSAVGIDGDQSPDLEQRGAIYVFGHEGQGWAQRAYVKAPQPVPRFGWSVSLSAGGDALAVGAPQESSGAKGIGGEQVDDSVSQAGAVYLY